jgi:LuxR family maltose regulon positive regulatory protein
VLRAYPRSRLANALVLFKQGSTAEVGRELRALAETHAGRADPLLSAEIAVFELGMWLYEDVPASDEQSAVLARVGAAVPRDQKALRALLGTTSCILQYDRGDLDAAIATADEALANFRAVRSLLGEVFAHVHQGRALLEMGRLRDALATLRQAWHLARDTTSSSTETGAITAAMLALAEYEAGNLEEAERLVSSALPTIEQGESWVELFASAYMAACALARHREGMAAALIIVQRARQMALTRNLPRLEHFADVIEMRERVFGGQITGPDVARLESALAACAGPEHAPRLRMRATLELARLALVRGQSSVVSMSVSRLAEEAQALRHQRVRIEALIMQSLALHALGQGEEAARALDDAVSLAMHEGYRQVFSDVGTRLLPLLQANDLVAPDPGLSRVRDRFLSVVVNDIQAHQPAPVTALDLSDRERTVLGLLADGLSNKAIAKTLSVSENTVKFHLKKLFAKLGVTTRRDAVAALESLRKS